MKTGDTIISAIENVSKDKSAKGISLSQALADFLADVKNSQSPATERTYRFVLNRFCRFLLLADLINPTGISQSDLTAATPDEVTLTTKPLAEDEEDLPLLELKPLEEIALNRLQTDWAIAFMRQLAGGGVMLPKPATTPTATAVHKKATASGAEARPASKATLAITAAALLRFYRWCSVERLLLIPSDEFERLTIRLRQLRGKPSRTIIDKVPSDEVVETLLQAARSRIDHTAPASPGQTAGLAQYDAERHCIGALRNLALLETLRSTGARVSEICTLTGGDLDHINKRARVVGKGNKERWVYFSSEAWQTLQAYLQARARFLQQAREEKKPETAQTPVPTRRKSARWRAGELAAQPVFARHDRGAGLKEIKPLTPRTIQKMLWELVEEAEVYVQITPHKFRHWFATKMLAGTGDLAVTQDLLGHANPATTRIYAQVSETKKQSAHKDVFK